MLNIISITFIIVDVLLIITVSLIINNNITGKNIFRKSLRDKIATQEKITKIKKDSSYRYREFIYKIIKFKEKFKLFLASRYREEEINIILERTFTKLNPDDLDFMTFKEYSAQNFLYSGITIILFIVPLILTNGFIKILTGLTCVFILFFINILRLSLLSNKVAVQNEILERYFGDFYLTQHHILMVEHKNPLTKGLQIYQHKVKDPYMQQWVKVTLQLLKNTNEEHVIDRYLILYKDIYTLCNLFNIEKQIINGGDCYLQLQGLRSEVLQKRTMDINDHADAIVRKALILRNIVFIIVFQVMIGAVIYFLLNGNVEINAPDSKKNAIEMEYQSR